MRITVFGTIHKLCLLNYYIHQKELSPQFGIRVTCIEPGAVDTELTETITDEELMDDFKDQMGDLNFLESKDIANSIYYAVSQPDDVHVNELQVRPTSQA